MILAFLRDLRKSACTQNQKLSHVFSKINKTLFYTHKFNIKMSLNCGKNDSSDLIYRARILISNLQSNTDKLTALKWIRKINLSTRTPGNEITKQDFLRIFIKRLEEGQLVYPFNQPPPEGSIKALYQLIVDDNVTDYIDPTKGRWAKIDKPICPQRPMLFKRSPDGGVFLASQPLPQRGVYCYIATTWPKERHYD